MNIRFVDSGSWGGVEWSRANFSEVSGQFEDSIRAHQSYVRSKLETYTPMLEVFESCDTYGFIGRLLSTKQASIIDPRTGELRSTTTSSKILFGEIQFIIYHFIDGPRLDLVFGYIYNSPYILLYHDIATAFVVGRTSVMDEIESIKHSIIDTCLKIEVNPSEYLLPKKILWSTADLNSVGHSYWQNLSALSFFKNTNLITAIDAITPMHHDFFGLTRYMRDTGILPVVETGDYLHVIFSDLYLRDRVRKTMNEIIPQSIWLKHQPTDPAPFIMFQLRASKRSWKGQNEGIANCINSLAERYPTMTFVIDGMSKLVGDQSDSPETYEPELQVFNDITSRVRDGISVKSIIGWEFPDKMALLSHMLIFCSPIGSGFIGTHWILNKRGVTYGPPAMYGWTLEHALYCNEGLQPLCWFPPEEVTAETDTRDSAFDLDWRRLNDLLVEQIELAIADRALVPVSTD